MVASFRAPRNVYAPAWSAFLAVPQLREIPWFTVAGPRRVTASGRDFDEFYRQHRDEIGRALALTLGEASLGQEAVDEAMARAYQRWDQLRDTANPAGWVYVVGRRWGLSWRRSRRREQRRERFVAPDDGAMIGPPIDASMDLMAALSELSSDQRAVVVCRFSLGMSVAETAEALGVREGTVKSRLARAIERLRGILELPE